MEAIFPLFLRTGHLFGGLTWSMCIISMIIAHESSFGWGFAREPSCGAVAPLARAFEWYSFTVDVCASSVFGPDPLVWPCLLRLQPKLLLLPISARIL